ncbi:hypothetical protein HYC85_020968 [Camellia sinensis]|uniref:FMN-dependent dehydrogenase domain-containing protein n=1 Tax=Camellia sinensis TaxID=4442 RepID=A0A7J7GIP1_CAMSI|nr:hypothetical protein HYC85_020968 [Camellia sinensis]
MIAPQPKNLEGLLSTEAVSDNGSKLAAFAAETLDPSLCWKDIDWLRSVASLPILVKGVLTAEDETFEVAKTISIGPSLKSGSKVGKSGSKVHEPDKHPPQHIS